MYKFEYIKFFQKQTAYFEFVVLVSKQVIVYAYRSLFLTPHTKMHLMHAKNAFLATMYFSYMCRTPVDIIMWYVLNIICVNN